MMSAITNLSAQCNNLLVNGDASAGLTGWSFSNGSGTSWHNPNSNSVFIASYEWSTMTQTIDLYNLGYTAEYLEQEPMISFSQMVECVHNINNSGGITYDNYYYKIQLKDTLNQVIDSYNYGSQSSPMYIYTTDGWDTISGGLTDYGAGLRYIYVECGGKDVPYWLGNYGPAFDNSTVTVANVTSVQQCGGSFSFDNQTLTTSGKYYAHFPEAFGCDSVEMLILQIDTIGIDYDIVEPYCFGNNSGSITAHASNGVPPYTFAWSNGGTDSIVSGLVSGFYMLTVADSTGCSDTFSVSLYEPDTLLAFAFLDSNVSCNGFSNGGATASAFGGTGAYTFSWSNGSTDSSITAVESNGYSVTITDANGCTDSSSVFISEPSELSVLATLDSNTTCYNANDGGASASASGGIPNYTYSWSNAASSSQIDGIASETYSVTVTDANGCTDSSSVFVGIDDNIFPVAIVQNANVYLDQSGFAYIDVLDIDNGSFDNCSIDSMYISLDSLYCSDVGINLVNFTIIDSNSNSVTTSAFVTVFDTVRPNIDNCPTEIIEEASSTCGFTLPDYALTMSISDSCGIQSIEQTPAMGTVVDTGATSVVIVVTDVNGNMDSCNFTLFVHDTELPVISCSSDTTICVSTFTYPTPTATDNCTELTVEQTEGLPSGSTFPVGSTTNTFVSTDSAGNQSSCSFTVTRDASPIQANAGSDTALCEESMTTLNAEDPSIGTGTWNSLGSATVANQNQNNSVVNNLTLGLNQFIWTVSNGVCPTSSDTVTIQIDANPSIADAGEDAELCDQNTYALDANDPSVGIGYWTTEYQEVFTDSLSPNTIVANLSGMSILTWNISNGVCPISSDDISIKVGYTPIISAGPDLYTQGIASVRVNVEINQPASIHWEPSFIMDDFDLQSTFANIKETTEVTVTATSDPSCTAYDTLEIRVLSPIEINTVFTPDGDNINDEWNIEGSESYPKMKVFVFNRWGAQVFESDEGYKTKFDGTFNGSLLPVSSYYYVIEFNDGITDTRDGNLTIIY